MSLEEESPVDEFPEFGPEVQWSDYEGHTPTKSKRGGVRVVTIVALVLAVSGASFILGRFMNRPANPVTLSPASGETGGDFGGLPSTSTPSIPAALPQSTSAAAKLAKMVDPGLVDVMTNISYQGASAAGTGIVISANGLILTNNHVIEGATSISVRDVATNVVYRATVVGYDASADVAVLQLKNASGLRTAPIGNSATLKSGQLVVGVGNAGGVGGTPSYAGGSVVALAKSRSAADPSNPSQMEQLTGMIETNASILPGDSGGPLVNAKGRIIGMDTAGSSSGFYGYDPNGSVAAQSYAIPINTALAIAIAIEKGQSSSTVHVGSTAYLGIEVVPTGSTGTGGFDYGAPQVSGGITIAGLVAGSPAASSGLAVGDVVTSVDGHTISTVVALSQYESKLKVGGRLTIGYTTTSGATERAVIKLAAGPPQ